MHNIKQNSHLKTKPYKFNFVNFKLQFHLCFVSQVSDDRNTFTNNIKSRVRPNES